MSSPFSFDPGAIALHGWSGPFPILGWNVIQVSFRDTHMLSSSLFLEPSRDKSCFGVATGLCGSSLRAKSQLSEDVKVEGAQEQTLPSC